MKPLSSIQLSFKCPRKLDELIPCAGGWYCTGCEKVIRDFRGKTEQDIQHIFAQNHHNLCGMFEADRIRVNTPFPKWLKWVSAAALTLGLQSCTKDIWPVDLQKTNAVRFTEKITSTENVIFGGMEQQAAYPGGLEKFHNYVTANLKPDSSCHPGGRAFATYTINKDGAVADAKVIRSDFNKEMDLQIIGILKKSKPWKPAIQNGKVVQSQFTIPIMPIPR